MEIITLSDTTTLKKLARILATTLLAVMTFSHPSYATKLYKWVDDDGTVHYSDEIPPKSIQRPHKEMNKQGITVRSIDAVKTRQQLEEERRLANIRKIEEARARKRALHDQFLLETYNSKEEMIEARDNRASIIDTSINIATTKINDLTKIISDLMKKAAHYERTGDEIPAEILTDIEDLKNQLESQHAFVKEKQEEKKELHGQFDADIKRFHELTAMKRNKQ